jgi:hypothetical protein
VSGKENTRRTWGACPNCSVDLSEGIKTRPPYDKCPFCGTPIEPMWWQRVAWVMLGLFLSFAFPAWLGIWGLALLFAALLCLFPATVFAYILVFKTMPPKYVRQQETFTTLFHRHH